MRPRSLALLVPFAMAACGSNLPPPGEEAGADAARATDAGIVPQPDASIVPGALVVDDQSSSNGQISLANGGSWYTYPLGSGAVTPTPGTTFFFTPVTGPDFTRAACLSASGITGFGAGMGFAFQTLGGDGVFRGLDAGAYSQISFEAMSPDAPDVLVTFLDQGTFPFAPGVTCAGGPDAGAVPDGGYPAPPCSNSPVAAVALSADWQLITLPFSGVSAVDIPGFYSPKSVDPTGLYFMTFGLTNPNARIDGGAPLSFHVCIAQVHLLP